MALGDIKHTNAPVPEIIYIDKGTGTLTAGIAVAFDSSGNAIPATASTLAPHGMYTGITHVVGATTYYGILMRGYGVMKAAGAIKPNKLVKSDSAGDLTEISTTVSTTPTQAQIQEIWKVIGRFVRVEDDDQYDPADAADNDSVIISVGAGWG